jgi:predicted dehydrogenase
MKSGKNRRVRYAVVGLGHIVQVAVLPAFRNAPNSELTALVSAEAKKLKQLSKQYRVDQTYDYSQYDQCLRDGTDAVYIGLPNHMHREYAVRALNAGVHVLCEKPMAVTSDECREMIDAARSNRRRLMIAYRLHFEACNLEAVRLAQSGRLGDLRFFSSDFAQQVVAGNVRLAQPVKAGGGPVYDMGIYCINAARYLFGAEPTEVLAASANNGEARFKKAGEMVSATLRFPGERLATFTASFGAADVRRYSLIGTKGSLTADPAYEYAEPLSMRIQLGEKSETRKFPKRDQFAAEISYFSDCILKNKQPEPSGEEGLADVRIIEAIYESAASGKAVRLAPLSKKQRPTPSQEIQRPAHEKPRTVDVESPSGEAA